MKDYITALSALVISAFVYVNSGSFVVENGGLAKNPAYYPRALALLLAILSAVLIIKAVIQRELGSVSVNKEFLKNVGIIFGLILLYVLSFQFVGFLVSSFVFLVCGVRLYGGSWKESMLCSVLVTAGVYIVFHILMKVPMPQGILF